jgi:two-component system, chemotaxis family, sensor kinase CheA
VSKTVAGAGGAPVDKYRQAFQEEAREVLVELESTLLELSRDPGDEELVGKAFRSLHTIKGSGAMFGFDDVAGFTHTLENAFDEVRNGRLAVSAKLVDLSLEAMDQIKAMLQQAAGEGTADAGACARILAELGELTGLRAGRADGVAGGEAEGRASAPPPADASASDRLWKEWRIRFRPGPDLMRDGTDPLLLLRELRQMGALRVVADLAGVPPLAELDPERCYIGWEMVLRTAAEAEAIRDVFVFAEDHCELAIEAVPAGVARGSPSQAAVPGAEGQAERGFGRRAEDRESKFGRRVDDRVEGGSSIRVPTAKLDQFVDLVGELVTVQARLGEIASRGDPDVVTVSEEVERLTAALRENSMSIRMLPIRATFERFRRLVHDLARDLHKEVELTIEGADTELDKTVIDQLNDPLMHLIRNSMDHGIERPERRVAAGKRAAATIHLSARHSGANVLIEVGDDGSGIDAEAVRGRAIERGLIAAEAQLSEAEIFALILSPGFSTATEITDVSGRGVGMDVVRQRVEALRGTIQISSRPGAGTSVVLRLPLTLAIIDGLLVRVGDAFFVLPLANSLECIELTSRDIADANGKHVANVRGEIIPYIRLREYFDIRTQRPDLEQIMVAETEEGRCGFVVDEVLGDHQTVIKNLGQFYRHVQFVSGATILGDGRVALILDPNRVVQDALKSSEQRAGARAHPPPPARGHPAAQMNSS